MDSTSSPTVIIAALHGHGGMLCSALTYARSTLRLISCTQGRKGVLINHTHTTYISGTRLTTFMRHEHTFYVVTWYSKQADNELTGHSFFSLLPHHPILLHATPRRVDLIHPNPKPPHPSFLLPAACLPENHISRAHATPSRPWRSEITRTYSSYIYIHTYTHLSMHLSLALSVHQGRSSIRY